MTSKSEIGQSGAGPRVISERERRESYKREAPYRPHWPATFEEADAHPYYHALLISFARSIPAFSRRRADVKRDSVGMPQAPLDVDLSDAGAPADAFVPVGPRHGPLPLSEDRKRLASGERDD